MKLWQGRLSGEVDERVNAINSSIRVDSRMYRQDIEGSIAHAEMLGARGIIGEAESAAIVEGLSSLLEDIESGREQIDMGCEDIHTYVEARLTERIGGAGKMLHTARSRNDQVATDLRMCLAHEIDGLVAAARALCLSLCKAASGHTSSVMPGYTHLQRAQPVTLAHYLMAYAAMLLRDIDRLADCKKRTLSLPLGCGALAGTTHPIDREYVQEKLGFLSLCENSIDGVSDRDFVIELAGCLSIIAVHLSRFAEEIILWCSSEFAFMSPPDGFSTGSSIMPQKKNPDVAELVRGKTGRVVGDAVALLTMMKGLPLAYNKDMQEDKEAIFDAVDTVSLCLELMAPMIAGASFNTQNMRAAAARGFINATDCADWLVTKGMPFRDAYKVAGRLVNYCIESGKTLETLSLDEYKKESELFDNGVYEAIDLENCVKRRASRGGPAPEAVAEQIAKVRAALAET